MVSNDYSEATKAALAMMPEKELSFELVEVRCLHACLCSALEKLSARMSLACVFVHAVHPSQFVSCTVYVLLLASVYAQALYFVIIFYFCMLRYACISCN